MPRKEIKSIQHKDFLDENKKIENTRLMSINTNGFNTENEEKTYQMIKYCLKWQIDIILMSETNVKWMSRTKEITQFKLK